MKPVTILTVMAALAVSTAHAKWQRLPSIEKKSVAMNSVSAGTTISSSKGIGQADALVTADPLKGVTLPSGKSEATIKFINQTWFDSTSFVSDGIEGKVSMSASSDAKEWVPLKQQVFTPSDRLVSIELGKVQARYVKLEFELSRGGKIRGFQILGADSDANYSVTQSQGEGSPVNFASGIGGGRLVYINPELFRGKGEALNTGRVDFPESDDKYRTAVYDLGQVRSLNEFGSVHSARPVRFAVFAFDNLPEKEDWRGRLAFDPTALDSAEPVATAEDAQGSGVVKVKPKKAIKARYIALRWEPDFNPPGFSSYSLSITGAANITYSGSGGVTVTTTQNADGSTTIEATGDNGVNLNINVDSNGNVTVSGTSAPDGTGGVTVTGPGGSTTTNPDGSTTVDSGGPAPPIVIGAPSSSGAGLGTAPPPPPPAPGGSASS